MAERIIAREAERKLLQETLASEEAQLLAVWGRRRIGKTFLVRNTLLEHRGDYFELTGVKNGKLAEQLFNFSEALSRYFQTDLPVAQPGSWGRAFVMLSKAIEARPDAARTAMLFFDEAPWLDTPKSGFLNALEHFWNTWASRQPYVKLVICGSSSSWILKKIVHGKGGWHRRVTRRLHLRPFTLAETKEYLQARGVRFSNTDLIELYMALGGTAQYLKEVNRGESVAACLNRLCFQDSGALRDEFHDLFHSLFEAAEQHIRIVTALAASRVGLTKAQIRRKSGIGAGRQFTQCMDNLVNADFVSDYSPFGKPAVRDVLYRLTDFFSVFHLRWIAPARRKKANWQLIHNSQAYRAWAGFTFETLVWNHIDRLLRDVGLQNVPTQTTKWRQPSSEAGEAGAEVDLLIDADKAGLYILELKHRDQPYEITKAENQSLLQKRQVLERATHSRRSIFVHLLASCGVVRNEYAKETVDYIYAVDCLFGK